MLTAEAKQHPRSEAVSFKYSVTSFKKTPLKAQDLAETGDRPLFLSVSVFFFDSAQGKSGLSPISQVLSEKFQGKRPLNGRDLAEALGFSHLVT